MTGMAEVNGIDGNFFFFNGSFSLLMAKINRSFCYNNPPYSV